MRETTTVRAMLLALAFIAGFGAMLAMRRARAPFAAWSRVSGVHARRFLPAIWWTLAAADSEADEIDEQRRAARFWIGCAIALLVVGLLLVLVIAFAT